MMELLYLAIVFFIKALILGVLGDVMQAYRWKSRNG